MNSVWSFDVDAAAKFRVKTLDDRGRRATRAMQCLTNHYFSLLRISRPYDAHLGVILSEKDDESEANGPKLHFSMLLQKS
jgi:hypothetical protein